MSLKNVSIADAAALAKKTGATRIAVITMDGGSYGITTWGITRRDCGALATWAESPAARRVVASISTTRPDDGVIRVAMTPGED